MIKISSRNGAVFDASGTYRYLLWRTWNFDVQPERMIAYVGLNPSIADGKRDDRTMTRLQRFSQDFGYDGFIMLNLFAFISPYPDVMKECAEPIGPGNDEYILEMASAAGKIVICWGNDGMHRDRGLHVCELLNQKALYCFGKTSKGHPVHPLYLPANRQLSVFVE